MGEEEEGHHGSNKVQNKWRWRIFFSEGRAGFHPSGREAPIACIADHAFDGGGMLPNSGIRHVLVECEAPVDEGSADQVHIGWRFRLPNKPTIGGVGLSV